jgi:monoterpene epsilon-lactone hydrolase
MSFQLMRLCGAVAICLVAPRVFGQPPDAPPAWPAREVPARLLPIPTDVSFLLQKAIASPPIAFMERIPETPDQWRAEIKKINDNAAKSARDLWKLLGVTVTPETIGGVKCFRLTPAEVPPEHKDRLLMHLHGGAYVFFGGEAGTGEGALIAYISKTPVISVDYRMPPDNPFPAALDDAVAVWQAVTKDHDAKKMAMFGTSAGGGLTLSAVLKLKGLGVPLPAALFIGTPSSDCTNASDSLRTNEYVDNVIPTTKGVIDACINMYAGGHDKKDPLISPVYGDLSGFPPTILISGTRDLLLSNTVRAHRKLRQSGVEAELHVFEAMSHAQYLTSFPSPESVDALKEVARFFDGHLAK